MNAESTPDRSDADTPTTNHTTPTVKDENSAETTPQQGASAAGAASASGAAGAADLGIEAAAAATTERSEEGPRAGRLRRNMESPGFSRGPNKPPIKYGAHHYPPTGDRGTYIATSLERGGFLGPDGLPVTPLLQREEHKPDLEADRYNNKAIEQELYPYLDNWNPNRLTPGLVAILGLTGMVLLLIVVIVGLMIVLGHAGV